MTRKHVTTSFLMATEKNKKPNVPQHEVTISDFTIGFSVFDLVENEILLVIFLGMWVFSEVEI